MPAHPQRGHGRARASRRRMARSGAAARERSPPQAGCVQDRAIVAESVGGGSARFSAIGTGELLQLLERSEAFVAAVGRDVEDAAINSGSLELFDVFWCRFRVGGDRDFASA